MTLGEALEVVDDSLPDGAWMESLCELTGLDAGEIAEGLRLLQTAREVLVEAKLEAAAAGPIRYARDADGSLKLDAEDCAVVAEDFDANA